MDGITPVGRPPAARRSSSQRATAEQGPADVFERSSSPKRSPLTTGNGYGLAVFSHQEGAVTKFYAHPYKMMRQNPQNPYADGPRTPNLIARMAFEAPLAATASYLHESNVVDAGGQRFFMPFGLGRSALIATSDAPAKLHIDWAQKVSSQQEREIAGRKVQVVRFKGIDDKVVVIPLDKRGSGVAIVGLESERDLEATVGDVVRWQGSAAPGALAAREASELDSWRAVPPPRLSGNELKLWRQSETVMRMAQIREPAGAERHAEGLLLASLPEGEWFIPWVRDMTYATVALTRMGHQAEARKALDAFLNAQPIGVNKALARGDDYQISTVRYNGDGSEMADQSGLDSPNVEFDSWGLALWSMGEYVRKYDDRAWLSSKTYRGTVYENMRDYIAKPMMDNLDVHGDGLIMGSDTSIWEQNDLPRMHYASSTITAIHGLRNFREIAARMGDQKTVATVDGKLALMQKGFEHAFVRDGRVRGTLESSPKNDMDAAVIEAVNFGVESDSSVVDATMKHMDALAEPSGGYRRVTGDTSYEKHEFLWSDFAMARAWLKRGQPAPAAQLVDRMVARSSADNYLIPEMYVSVPDDEFPGKIGDPTGAIPMVGYGAGLYTMYLLDRAEGEAAPGG